MTNRDGQKRHCQNAGGALLVDYCDGELSALESVRVEEHLQRCSVCRSQVSALRASLEIAQEIWHDRAEATAGNAVGRGHARHRLRVATALAASAAAIIVCIVWWAVSGQMRRDIIDVPNQVAENPPPVDSPSDGPLDADDVEAIIFRQVQSARLAVAVKLLAADPELKPYHDSAQEYLADVYGPADDTTGNPTRSEQGI